MRHRKHKVCTLRLLCKTGRANLARQATVDDQSLTRYESGSSAGEKQHGFRDIFWAPKTSQGMLRDSLRQQFAHLAPRVGLRKRMAQQIRIYIARSDSIHPHPGWGVIDR
jgi:hypothetical protein